MGIQAASSACMSSAREHVSGCEGLSRVHDQEVCAGL